MVSQPSLPTMRDFPVPDEFTIVVSLAYGVLSLER